MPIRFAFGPIPHQVGEFPSKKDLTKVVWRSVAQRRNRLAEQKPKRPPGRPKTSKRAEKLRLQAKAIRQRICDLFEHRHLFVRHHLDAKGRALLRRLTRSQGPLSALRAIMDEGYRLFDRRCRTDTALAKWTRRRRGVRRSRSLGKVLDKLNSPTLEKALTFLDDKVLPATSTTTSSTRGRGGRTPTAKAATRTSALT